MQNVVILVLDSGLRGQAVGELEQETARMQAGMLLSQTHMHMSFTADQ